MNREWTLQLYANLSPVFLRMGRRKRRNAEVLPNGHVRCVGCGTIWQIFDNDAWVCTICETRKRP